MELKKILIITIVLLLCIGMVIATKIVSDNTKPSIEIKKHDFMIGCDVTKDELLSNVVVKDDVEVKNVIIEEKDFEDIVENKKVTYVAVDTSNNVTKRTLYLDLSQDIKDLSINVVKNPIFDINSEIKLSDYFKVTNKCGWEYEARYDVENLDITKPGEYDVKVIAKVKGETISLNTKMIVKDNSYPSLSFNTNDIRIKQGDNFDITSYIKVSDDKDSEDYLLNHIEVIGDLDTDVIGKYSLEVKVYDSDENMYGENIQVTVIE